MAVAEVLPDVGRRIADEFIRGMLEPWLRTIGRAS
jgi:hypothetical protein